MGVRFHVQDGIIHIEIQCGTLVNGQVDPNTVRWNMYDRQYTRKNHPNYIILNSELREFNIDDIVGKDGSFVTGVKFDRLGDNHITLAVYESDMYDSNNKISIRSRARLIFPENTQPR